MSSSTTNPPIAPDQSDREAADVQLKLARECAAEVLIARLETYGKPSEDSVKDHIRNVYAKGVNDESDDVQSALLAIQRTQASIAAAVADERARCAAIAEKYPERDPGEDGSGYWAANEIAAAIKES